MATATGPASNRGQGLPLPGTDSTHGNTRKMLYQTSSMEQPGVGRTQIGRCGSSPMCTEGQTQGKAKNILEHWFSHLWKERHLLLGIMMS